jgi:hypothetical protein
MQYTPADLALNGVVELTRTLEAMKIDLGALRRRVEQLEENNGRRSESSPAVSQ